MSIWELPRPLGRWFSALQLHDGDVLPKWYGVAWHCPFSARAYCLPIPLNRIAGSFRAFWLELRRPCPDDPVQIAYTFGRSEGFGDGRRSGQVSTLAMLKDIRR